MQRNLSMWWSFNKNKHPLFIHKSTHHLFTNKIKYGDTHKYVDALSSFALYPGIVVMWMLSVSAINLWQKMKFISGIMSKINELWITNVSHTFSGQIGGWTDLKL